jgi:hypothetical protein
MKNTVLTFGIYSVLLAAILFSTVLYSGFALAFKTHGIIGYATMVVSLLYVYFGIKHYKDHELNDALDFKTAFKVGAVISIFTAITFGTIDAIYITYNNPDFIAQYLAYEYGLLDAQTDISPEELYYEKLSILKQSEAFKNPIMIFFVTTMMVFVIGAVMSILSALLLRDKHNESID